MTQKPNKVIENLIGTSRINPDDYSPITSPNRFKSLGYALAGWLYMLRWQKNVRIQAVASIIVGGVAFWLRIDAIGWALLILAITMVWVAEFVNAAIEAAINLSTQDIHPMAQVGKDVASAAVLLCVVASVLIGLLVLGPPLLERFGILI